MDSGTGKNQDGIQAKEPAEPPPPAPPSERLREEPNTAAAAAAADEPPQSVTPSERLQERAHGSPEAGGQNPAAAEAAAAAQRSGTGIEAASRRGSAAANPTSSPRAASASRVKEPKPAGGKPPLQLPRRAVVPASRSKSKGKKPMSDAEVVESGMAMKAKWKAVREGQMDVQDFSELLQESKKAMPEGTATRQKGQRNFLWRRNMLIIIVVLLALAYLPARTAFQQFKTVKDAANGLAPLTNLNDLRLQLREEAPAIGFSLGHWCPLFTIFGACLMGGLASWFVDPGQEPGLPVEGEPQLPEINVTATLLLFVALVTVVLVTVRCLRGER